MTKWQGLTRRQCRRHSRWLEFRAESASSWAGRPAKLTRRQSRRRRWWTPSDDAGTHRQLTRRHLSTDGIPSTVGARLTRRWRADPTASFSAPTPGYADGSTPTAAVGSAWPDGLRYLARRPLAVGIDRTFCSESTLAPRCRCTHWSKIIFQNVQKF
jgi:hypothetical protein